MGDSEEMLSDDERMAILNELHNRINNKKVVEGHPVLKISPSPDVAMPVDCGGVSSPMPPHQPSCKESMFKPISQEENDALGIMKGTPESFGSLLEKTLKRRQKLDEEDAIVKDEVRDKALELTKDSMYLIEGMCEKLFR